MAITKKMLVVLLLTIIFVTSSVHCSDSALGIGIKEDWEVCFSIDPCLTGEGTLGCTKWCRNHINLSLVGYCRTDPEHCCCVAEK
ncbi:Defensin-like protein 116 [Arabidopsis thaliana]|uniref:Uncharacterized protein n=3 Tax=Arabidopsis TaxID=3701 RepID=A0A178ULN1_ARATH|nr:hypothetical protein ISN45_At05g036850 [Arabidopsis thaliana x Arabidopsis arenosa]KAG7611546.1 hypothetical protein ISN44_As05g036380 [Arabidopsis suecica]OAO93561.1 hypothetical protein AXX17_AT5G40060 [Arabidopsis thaliana]